MNRYGTALITLAVFLITPLAHATEAVGKIGYMSGSLIAKRADGAIKVMGMKSDVMIGDALETSADSYAQILMNDGSRMTLRPQSNLKIEAFHFNKEVPQEDNAAFRLLKGGFRTVSGLIGKRGNPDAYQLRASGAVIGIRGTDFTSRLCANDCDNGNAVKQVPATPATTPPPAASVASPDAAGAVEPGVYVTVHEGQIIMAQESGKSIDVGKGQTGFVNAQVITQLPSTPKFMTTDKPIEVKESAAVGNKPSADTPSQSGCVVK